MQNINETGTQSNGADFTLTVRPGRQQVYATRKSHVFCKIEYKAGRLSITGVVGPTPHGNAAGGCGQIRPVRLDEYAPGWTPAMLARFNEVWERWHLNDMSPACEHQRAEGWREMAGEQVTLYHFRLRKGIADARRENEKEAVRALKAGASVQWSDEAVKQANLPQTITHDAAELPALLAEFYEPNRPQYTGDSYNRPSETKARGWLRVNEHPLGLLSKPCGVCGYKYGSSWLREEIPADVLDFLRSLPKTDITPAWV